MFQSIMPLRNFKAFRGKRVRKRLRISQQYSVPFDVPELTRIAINVKKYAFTSGIFITRHLRCLPEATSNIRHSKVRAKGNCGMLTQRRKVDEEKMKGHSSLYRTRYVCFNSYSTLIPPLKWKKRTEDKNSFSKIFYDLCT